MASRSPHLWEEKREMVREEEDKAEVCLLANKENPARSPQKVLGPSTV